jgi:serine/threonine protein kinase
MSPPNGNRRSPATTLDLDIDEVCDKFEDAWKRGRTPSLKAYLARMPARRHGALLEHLLVLELRYRRRRGQMPLLRDFLRRFPDYADRVRAAFDSQAPIDKSKPSPQPRDPHDFSLNLDDKPPKLPGFQILERIGAGGMGIVYKARNIGPDLIVAVKVLPPELFARDRPRKMFRREAQNMVRLIHDNIVRLHNYNLLHIPPFFSMEYVEGGSLADKLNDGVPDPLWSARLLATLARCLKYIHDQNVLHRDLKPANILLKADGKPKIADFGLGKCPELDSYRSLPHVVLGTPSYMSPEAAEGKEITKAADIYGLGAILYECLAGRPPFKAETYEATRQLVVRGDPVPPSDYDASVPPALERICLRCLAKDPALRYADGITLAEDLERYSTRPLAPRQEREEDWHPQWAKNAGYEILELIGCSFAGMVYKARQLEPLNRIVTLMTLSTRALHDPARMARFRASAEAAAQLQHPNIVPIYGYDVHAGQPHFSMEYLSGGTLASRCNGQPWSMREAVEIIITLAAAAGYAHQRNIVHGDLRPFNVSLSDGGIPKITGFGLGSLVDKNPDFRRGVRIGLSNYMAPEVAQGRPENIGPATDVHALGAMLYELLTGRPPFLADNIKKTIHQVLTRKPPAPSKLRPGLLSPALDSVCLRCLNKNPADRFANASELANELTKLLDDDRQQTGEFQLIPGYEMLEPLGQDEIGTTYKARQVSLDRLVVLKIFEKDGRRFVRSNQAVARLNHPNLVQIIDCGQRERVLFVVEEFIEGTDLEQKMRRHRQSPSDAASLVEVLARALHHVHRQKMVHRNLNPRLIRMTPLGVPKITGFDLALRLDERPLDSDGTGGGTPRYMAPEQLDEGKAITPATDVFALGMILYELLTGISPFHDDDVLKAVENIRNRVVVPPSKCVRAVDKHLDVICLKCLEKRPTRRFRSAKALGEALKKWLSHKR